jgi:pimeloyl-ACP methyl ester carboxylesterase
MITEKTLDFQKRKIFYRIIGEGPLVMLLHGIPFEGNLWKSQVETLQGFKFIVPDLPGSGASELIDDMSMEGMAEVIKAIFDSEDEAIATPTLKDTNSGVTSNPEARAWVASSVGEIRMGAAVLVGHSMGGYISLAFAEKYPDYLAGLGLFHSTAYPDTDERKATRIKAIESIKNDGAESFLKTMMPNLFSPHSRANMASKIEQFVAQTNNFSGAALVSYYEAMMRRPDRTSVLRNLKIPMLMIAGKYDNAAPLNDLLNQCHLSEISYFHILSESGHMGMIEEVGKSNQILNDYLTNLS